MEEDDLAREEEKEEGIHIQRKGKEKVESVPNTGRKLQKRLI